VTAPRELPALHVDLPGPLTDEQVRAVQKVAMDHRLTGYQEGWGDAMAATEEERRTWFLIPAAAPPGTPVPVSAPPKVSVPGQHRVGFSPPTTTKQHPGDVSRGDLPTLADNLEEAIE
jgi:hypothetical protein